MLCLKYLKTSRSAAVGDLWVLGRHQIFCGNALKGSSYKTLLRDSRAAMIFTDPPYNVPIDGHATGLGRIRHQNFEMASGEMSESRIHRIPHASSRPRGGV